MQDLFKIKANKMTKEEQDEIWDELRKKINP
jgi:hypothetical protein